MKLKAYLPLIKSLKLEPFMLIFMVAHVVQILTVIQLFQDKVCVNEYRYGAKFCRGLKDNSADSVEKKSNVLGDAAVYVMYESIISAIPIIAASLFIGSWIDKYDNSIKILLLVSSIGGMLESILFLINAFYFEWQTGLTLIAFIPSAFSGSFVYVFMAAFSYIPKTTVQKWRSIRYSIMELAMYFGYPIGQFLSGYLIERQPIGEHVFRNYIAVFIVSVACYLFCIIWILLVFRDVKSDLLIVNEETGEPENKEEFKSKDQKWYSIFKNIFVLENVRETFRTCFQKRGRNKGRLQIWLIITSLYVISIQLYGTTPLLYPFTERVFEWTPFIFSKVNAINTAVSNILMMICVSLFVKTLHVKDIRLAIIGCVSYMLLYITRGSLIDVISFNVSYYVGLLGNLSSIGARSYISRLVSQDELGKIFSMIAALESTIKIVSGVMFQLIFKLTVRKMPYLIFILSAICMFYPLIAVMYLDLKFEAKNDEPSARNAEDKESVLAMSDNLQSESQVDMNKNNRQ